MSTLNEVIEYWETLDIETKEDTLEILQKGLIEDKRDLILDRINEAKSNLISGKTKSGSSKDLFRDISNV